MKGEIVPPSKLIVNKQITPFLFYLFGVFIINEGILRIIHTYVRTYVHAYMHVYMTCMHACTRT